MKTAKEAWAATVPAAEAAQQRLREKIAQMIDEAVAKGHWGVYIHEQFGAELQAELGCLGYDVTISESYSSPGNDWHALISWATPREPNA